MSRLIEEMSNFYTKSLRSLENRARSLICGRREYALSARSTYVAIPSQAEPVHGLILYARPRIDFQRKDIRERCLRKYWSNSRVQFFSYMIIKHVLIK
jgi:hypothetical protein